MGAHPGFGSGGADSMEQDGKMCDDVNKVESKLILNGSYDAPIKVNYSFDFRMSLIRKAGKNALFCLASSTCCY